MMSFFILSFLFSGCAGESEGLSPEIEIQIGELLDIKEPIYKNRHNCQKIPIYKEPPVRNCTKNMTKDECLLYMSKISMSVRYQLRKQIKVCEAHNEIIK
jgi:hypothetical protein